MFLSGEQLALIVTISLLLATAKYPVQLKKTFWYIVPIVGSLLMFVVSSIKTFVVVMFASLGALTFERPLHAFVVPMVTRFFQTQQKQHSTEVSSVGFYLFTASIGIGVACLFSRRCRLFVCWLCRGIVSGAANALMEFTVCFLAMIFALFTHQIMMARTGRHA
jgi:hypothetical protein